MKNASKRMLSLVLTLVLLFVAVPVALPVSAFNHNELDYYVCGPIGAEYAEIYHTDALALRGDYEIPEYLSGYSGRIVPVTTLRTGSFQNRFITSVVIPDTVTSLGSGWTFDGCRQMKTVTLSKNVTVIPSSAFANCDVLESINLGNNITEIEGNAFSGCPKLTLVLPISIQEIGYNAFGGSYGGVKCVYYPGTAAQWNKVTKDYSVEEKVLCQPTIDKVESTTKGIQVTASKRNATKYTFYRQQLVNGKWSAWAKVADATTNTFTDSKAAIGGTYRYAVAATNGAYTTLRSDAGESITHLPTTTAKVSKASKGYKVTWSKVTGASKYIVYRRTGSGKWKTLKTTTARSYTDKTAKSGYKYQYGVKVVKGSLKSALAKTEQIMRLATPKVKAAVGVYKDGDLKRSGIKLTWGKVKSATTYEVYRREGSGAWVMCTITTSRTYVDYWPVSGKYNSYRVRAISSTTNSSYGTTKKIKYLEAPQVGAFKSFGIGIYVNWTNTDGAKKYVVYRRVGSGKWKKFKTTKSTAFTDTSTKVGKSYSYKVVAYNGKYKSAYLVSKKVKR